MLVPGAPARHTQLPFVAQHAKKYRVLDLAVDVVARAQQSLPTEAQALEERKRCRIAGIDVGLEPVQVQGVEAVSQQAFDRAGRNPRPHQAEPRAKPISGATMVRSRSQTACGARDPVRPRGTMPHCSSVPSRHRP